MVRTFKPSVQQQAIFDFAMGGRGSAIIIAVAGSGKSTTMIQMLPLFPENCSVHMFAFNTPIAAELKEKITRLADETGRAFRGVRASTFHSVGYAAVIKKLGLPRDKVAPDGKKMMTLAKELLGEIEYELYASFSCKLVGLAKGQGFGAIMPADEGAWLEMIRHHDMYLDDEDATEERAVEIARQLLRKSNEVARAGIIDYDDQLYLPLLWRCRLWQNDVVIIDEAQDTNPVRRAIAKLALKPGGRLFAVGDPRQAIYGFTGASHDALDLIKSEFRCVELPLTVSYRCSAAVGAQARTLVDYFQTAPGAAPGTVADVSLKDAMAGGLLGSEDAVLCRNTAPLIDLAFNLIGKGIGCAIMGRDIAANLVNLIKRQKAKGIPNLCDKLAAYREREVAKFTARGEEAKAEAVSDRVACILTVVDHLSENERTVPLLIAKIESMFADGGKVLQLATVHKVKGKEYRNVAILKPELMPSKWARQEWQYNQELNLQYVAWTRPTDGLFFLTTETL